MKMYGGVEVRCCLYSQRSEPQEFDSLHHRIRSALGPPSSPFGMVSLSPRVKRPELEVDGSTPYRGIVKIRVVLWSRYVYFLCQVPEVDIIW
jgi:hypothetical protein